ncbi:MAG: SDR family oxidoreductase [Myxococcota bacterium]|nr:SDR family oxidoreductase [Myxococcota bacterium]
MPEQILVVGATGKVGSQVLASLLEQNVSVRAATRQPEAQRALTDRGVPVVRLDFDDPSTFDGALDGIKKIFLCAPPGDVAPEQKLNLFVDAANKHGVSHIALMTAMDVDQDEDIGLRKVERHVEKSGIGYTFIRPNWFMQNFSAGMMLPSILESSGIFLPAGEAKTSFVDTWDIAEIAVRALTEDGHASAEYTVTGGQALTYGEVAAIISEAAGKEVQYHPISDEQAAQGLAEAGFGPDQIQFMLGLFSMVKQGYTERVVDDVNKVLGRPPGDFANFAKQNAAAWR